MDNFKILFVAFSFLLLISGCVENKKENIEYDPQTMAKYKQAWPEAIANYVVLQKNQPFDKQKLLNLTRYFCQKQDHCFVYFWDDFDLAAKRSPMTEKQLGHMIAQYSRNRKTGHKELLIRENGYMKSIKIAFRR